MSETSEQAAEISGKNSTYEFTPNDLKDSSSRRRFLRLLGAGTLYGSAVYLTYSSGPEAANKILEGPLGVDVQQKMSELAHSLPSELSTTGPIHVRGKQVLFMGVSHDMNTYIEYKESFREAIKQSPFVVLEYFNQEIREKALPTVTDTELNTYDSFNETAENFFSGLGKICAEEGKDVIVINPQMPGTERMELALTYGVSAGASIDVAATLLATLRQKVGNQIDRRNFFKVIGTVAAVYAFNKWESNTRKLRGMLENNGILKSDLSEKEKADILGWFHVDWRDVRAADGFESIAEVYKEEIGDQPFVSVNGSYHNGVTEYLQNPILRAAKRPLYLQYDVLGDTSIRRFRFDKEQNKWKQTDTKKY